MTIHERFEAWKEAHRLALELYRISDEWPREERFGLTAQLRRASVSIPANIAEGVAKYGARELRRFLDIALGSLSELSYFLLFARDRGLLQPVRWEVLEAQRDQVGKLTWGLARAVGRKTARREDGKAGGD